METTPRAGIVKPNLGLRDWGQQLLNAIETIDAKMALREHEHRPNPASDTPHDTSDHDGATTGVHGIGNTALLETGAGAAAKIEALVAYLTGPLPAHLVTRRYYARTTPEDVAPPAAPAPARGAQGIQGVEGPQGMVIHAYDGDANLGPCAIPDGGRVRQPLCQMPPTHAGITLALLVTSDDANLLWVHGIAGEKASLWMARPPAYAVPVLLDELPAGAAGDFAMVEDGDFIWVGPHRTIKEKFLGQ